MIERITTDEREVILIGTAHVFKESVDEVKETILSERPEAVCIELDMKRYYGLMNGGRMGFMEMVKSRGMRFAVIAWILEYIERRIGEEMGILPGKEMLTAVECSKEINANLYLIDRDAEITIEKMTKVPMREKLKILKNIFFSFFKKEEISLELSKENIDLLIENLREISPYLYRVLIEERDAYMAERIKELKEKKIVVVTGAGHIKGMIRNLSGLTVPQSI